MLSVHGAATEALIAAPCAGLSCTEKKVAQQRAVDAVVLRRGRARKCREACTHMSHVTTLSSSWSRCGSPDALVTTKSAQRASRSVAHTCSATQMSSPLQRWCARWRAILDN